MMDLNTLTEGLPKGACRFCGNVIPNGDGKDDCLPVRQPVGTRVFHSARREWGVVIDRRGDRDDIQTQGVWREPNHAPSGWFLRMMWSEDDLLRWSIEALDCGPDEGA